LANASPAKVVITKTVLHMESPGAGAGAGAMTVSKETISKPVTGPCTSKGDTLLRRRSLPTIAEGPLLLGEWPIEVTLSLTFSATLNSKVLSAIVVAISDIRDIVKFNAVSWLGHT
jgi:hypothetical protein